MNRDQIVYDHFSKRFEELFQEKSKAESKVINYMTEVSMQNVCKYFWYMFYSKILSVWDIEKQHRTINRRYRGEGQEDWGSKSIVYETRRRLYNDTCELWRANLRADRSSFKFEWSTCEKINPLFPILLITIFIIFIIIITTIITYNITFGCIIAIQFHSNYLIFLRYLLKMLMSYYYIYIIYMNECMYYEV